MDNKFVLMAEKIVSAAFCEAAEDSRNVWNIDYTSKGEAILVKHIAEALEKVSKESEVTQRGVPVSK